MAEYTIKEERLLSTWPYTVYWYDNTIQACSSIGAGKRIIRKHRKERQKKQSYEDAQRLKYPKYPIVYEE